MNKSLSQKVGFRQFLKKHYLMSPNDKRDLVEKNLTGLKNIIILLFIYSLSMFVYSLIKSNGAYKENFIEILHYIIIFFLSLHAYILLRLAKKHKEWRPTRRNETLYLVFLIMLVIFTYRFYFTEQKINSLILFAVISVLTVTFFAIEPLIYGIIVSLFGILLIIGCLKFISITAAIDFFLLCFVLVYFSLFKWRTTIIHQKYSQQLKMHSDNINKELKLASYVQQSFYKNDLSGIYNFEIKVFNEPMAGVSGDLYDFFRTGPLIDGIGLFDISGHGLSSGLITMLVRNIIHQEFYKNKEIRLENVAHKIDERFKNEKGGIENYMTGILIRVNEKNPEYNMEIINAGHQNPIIYKKSENKLYFLDEKKFFRSSVIGLDYIDSYFDTIDFNMESGDEMILYTDGIVEGINQEREEFGKMRLIETVSKMIAREPDNIENQQGYLLSHYKSFIGNANPIDDITIIIIKRK